MPTTVFGPDHEHLVAVLVEARNESGLMQVELAERVGKSQTHISNIERGQRRVDVLEFIALARAMGVRPRDLFERLDARIEGARRT
jgi:transcriptional regulator with XRE-family HTH domain